MKYYSEQDFEDFKKKTTIVTGFDGERTIQPQVQFPPLPTPINGIVVTKEQLSKYHSWVLEYNEVNRESAEVMNGYILLNWITQNKCPIVF